MQQQQSRQVPDHCSRCKGQSLQHVFLVRLAVGVLVMAKEAAAQTITQYPANTTTRRAHPTTSAASVALPKAPLQ
jgi:hypothetical protein